MPKKPIEKILKPKSSYELIDWIGEGSNAIVYHAVKKDPNSLTAESVALKVFKSESVASLLMQEYQSIGRVNSPFCIRSFGWESFSKGAALVLEYIDGVSLRSFMAQTPITPEIIDELSQRILAGLLDIHASGLCHGDITPNNILIDRRGRVVLVDYGHANAAESNSGSCLYTPAYAAPEVLSGKACTPESDLYSFGMIRQELASFCTSQLTQKFRDDQKILVNCEPSKRTQQLSIRRPEAAFWTELGVQVDAIKGSLSKETTSFDLPEIISDTNHRGRYLVSLALVSLFAFPFTLSGSSIFDRNPFGGTAFVSIRSAKWCKASINGKRIGDFPIENMQLPKGTYSFDCVDSQGQKKSLERTLLSGSNEVIVFWTNEEPGGRYAKRSNQKDRSDHR